MVAQHSPDVVFGDLNAEDPAWWCTPPSERPSDDETGEVHPHEPAVEGGPTGSPTGVSGGGSPAGVPAVLPERRQSYRRQRGVLVKEELLDENDYDVIDGPPSPLHVEDNVLNTGFF